MAFDNFRDCLLHRLFALLLGQLAGLPQLHACVLAHEFELESRDPSHGHPHTAHWHLHVAVVVDREGLVAKGTLVLRQAHDALQTVLGLFELAEGVVLFNY